MRGYKYLVRGENEQEIKAPAPSYQVKLCITNPRKLITLETVWNCPGYLLTTLDQDLVLKDVCLSYALYKLLRCQITELSLPREYQELTQKLIFEGVLLESNNKRVFRIMEMQMAFLFDYYYTRLPIGVWYGYPLIKFVTLLVTILFGFLVAIDVHKTEPISHDLYHYINGENVDHIITYALLILIVLKETWEMIVYILSNWTKLVVICRYVEGSWLFRNRMVEHIILLLCRSNVITRSHKKMAQYNFLESFNYKPRVKEILYYVTLHLIKKPIGGGKVGKKIRIFKEVKESIIDALININHGELLNGLSSSLYNQAVGDSYQWACKQETCSHLILVWHIATSMCEIQLSEGARHAKSCSNPFFNKCTAWWLQRQPFIVDLKSLDDKTRPHYVVPNSISRYCAYLLVFEPELLPDHYLVSEQVFRGTISDARYLLGCGSLESILEKLKNIEVGPEGIEERTIVQNGAILGRELLGDQEMNSEALWKMLANFWVNLLLYLAPSKVTEHKSCLIRGEFQFITLLWALFSNCGIFDRIGDENQVRANVEVKGDGRATVNQVPANDSVTTGEQRPRSSVGKWCCHR